MADLKSERILGKIACQETGSSAQAYGAACRGIRVIRRKLDCLNPNLQEAQINARRKDACNRCQSLRQDYLEPAAILWELERCPVRAFKEMSGAPKSR
jgi:hypothetical protein